MRLQIFIHKTVVLIKNKPWKIWGFEKKTVTMQKLDLDTTECKQMWFDRFKQAIFYTLNYWQEYCTIVSFKTMKIRINVKTIQNCKTGLENWSIDGNIVITDFSFPFVYNFHQNYYNIADSISVYQIISRKRYRLCTKS